MSTPPQGFTPVRWHAAQELPRPGTYGTRLESGCVEFQTVDDACVLCGGELSVSRAASAGRVGYLQERVVFVSQVPETHSLLACRGCGVRFVVPRDMVAPGVGAVRTVRQCSGSRV